jgi:chromosome segregation ATPase
MTLDGHMKEKMIEINTLCNQLKAMELEINNLRVANTDISANLEAQAVANAHLKTAVAQQETFIPPLKAENVGLKQQLEVLLKDHERLARVSSEALAKNQILQKEIDSMKLNHLQTLEKEKEII